MCKRKKHYNRHYVKKSTGRNYEHDQAYEDFRKEVRERDNCCCQWPGCRSKKKLEVHHILKWSDHPHLRYITANGITLCRYHHKLVKNKEQYFVEFFRKILELQILQRIKNGV